MQRLSAGWKERQAEPRAGRESGKVLPRVQTRPSTSLPRRHDFIFSVNCIFFSEDKDLDKKKGIRTSQMPSQGYDIRSEHT